MKDNLVERIYIRLSAKEYNKLQSMVKKFQFGNVSTFVRYYLFSERKNLIDPISFLKGMNELTVAVNRVGNNINQIAKILNMSKDVNDFALMKEWNENFSEYMTVLREVDKKIEQVYTIKSENI